MDSLFLNDQFIDMYEHVLIRIENMSHGEMIKSFLFFLVHMKNYMTSSEVSTEELDKMRLVKLFPF